MTRVGSRFGSTLAPNRVTDVSRIRGTRKTRKDTRGHDGKPNRVQGDTRGNVGTREDTRYAGFGTVRPRVQFPGPRPKSEYDPGVTAVAGSQPDHSFQKHCSVAGSSQPPLLRSSARRAAGRRDHPQRAILDAREEDLLSVRRPAGVGGPKVVARKPPGLATRGGNDPDRPMAVVDGPHERHAPAVWREGRVTFTSDAVQRKRLVQSDGIAPVGLSDLDAEIALFDAAVVLVSDPAAVR